MHVLRAARPTRRRRSSSLPANRYACPQTLFKFHPDFDAALAGILRADPDGVLLLIEGRVPDWTAQLRARWERVMPDVFDRIHWLPAVPREQFLELLAASDVMLDPFPFGGGNTSYEALAMGTPVVTLPGDLLRGRITRALYAKAGVTGLVADSVEAYVATALRVAANRERIGDEVDVLFADADEVRDLEDFLEMIAP